MKKLVLLILFLLLTSVNIVFAKTYDLSQISQVKLVTEYSAETTVDEMDTVTFGSYPQSNVSGNTKEPIEWIVLDRQGNRVFLLSKYILDCKSYDDVKQYATWEECTLRQWLNSEFLNNAFTTSEQDSVAVTNVATMWYDESTTHKGEFACSNTYDKCFLLSEKEIKSYFKANSGYGNNRSRGTSYAIAHGLFVFNHTASTMKQFNGNTNWMLRTPTYSTSHVMFADYDGSLNYIGMNVKNKKTYGVRPALWINMSGLQSNSANNNSSNANSSAFNIDVRNGDFVVNNVPGGVIRGLPSRESELRSDNHFYLDNNMQKSTWVYYKTYYYHVDGNGNIQKNQWIELRYVGEDGRMYRGRQTPDGKWVGDDGLVVDVGNDLSKSLTIEVAEPDSWYKTQSGLWYYFENDRTTTKKGWFIDKRDNQTYYLDPQTGIMAVGWTNIGGNWYYFNESHNNEVNWYETGGGFYESYNKKVKAYGSMYKNETTPDGKKVDANGRLVIVQSSQESFNQNNNITMPQESINSNNKTLTIRISGKKSQNVDSSNGHCTVKFLNYELECDNSNEMNLLKQELKQLMEDFRYDWLGNAEDGWGDTIEETLLKVKSIDQSMIRFEYKLRITDFEGTGKTEVLYYYIDWDREDMSISAEAIE